MLSTRVQSLKKINFILFLCYRGKISKQNLSFQPLDEQSILMKLPVCYNLKINFISLVYLANDWSHLFSSPPTPPRQSFVKFSVIAHFITYGSIPLISIICFYIQYYTIFWRMNAVIIHLCKDCTFYWAFNSWHGNTFLIRKNKLLKFFEIKWLNETVYM